MIPRLFEIGPIPINSFGLCVALAAWGSIFSLSRSFKRNGIDPKLGEKYVLWGILTGLIGARSWSLIKRWDQVMLDPIGEIFSGAGFVFYGGFITATVVLIFLCYRDKISLPKFLDSLAPTLALGYGIGRLGCQLSGDGDYGIATTSIFGMAYPHGVIPTPPGVLVFPTPFYESVIAFSIAWFLFSLERRGVGLKRPYFLFGFYLVLISLERFFIEFLRINPKFASGLSEAQYVAIGLTIVGGLMVVITSRFASSKQAVRT